jgi:hypothetical protein
MKKFSALFAGLLPLALFACAPDQVADDADGVDLGEDAQDLTARSAKYVGMYTDKKLPLAAFASLSLNADGTFNAMTEAKIAKPGSTVVCVVAPCTLAESGTFRVLRVDGSDVLVIDPVGPNNARRYTVTQIQGGDVLELLRGGKRFRMNKKVDVCARVRCGARTECQEQQDGTAACVPVLHPGCAALSCLNGQKCIPDPNDAAQATCAATCQVIRCAAGTECIDPVDAPARCEATLPAACAATTCAQGNACIESPNNPNEAICVATCQLLECMPGKTCQDTRKGAICR